MSLLGIGDMSTMALEQENVKPYAEWENANGYNWKGSKQLQKGLHLNICYQTSQNENVGKKEG